MCGLRGGCGGGEVVLLLLFLRRRRRRSGKRPFLIRLQAMRDIMVLWICFP